MLSRIANPHSNWIPRSPADADAVRAILTELQGMVGVESRIAHSRPPIHPPEIIIHALERVRRLLSPFQLLPQAVLSKIFEHFVQAPKTSDSRRKALILCGVSSRWRTVAISTPRLWTSIELHVRPGWNPIFERICLSRSSPLVLRVHLRCADFVPAELDEAICLISRNISRIQYLSLDLHPRCGNQSDRRPGHVFPAFKGGIIANQLTMLSVSLPARIIAWEWISTLMGNAPKLYRLSFSCGEFLPNMPWSQLVQLSLGPVNVSDSLSVLAQAPRLRDCDLIIISSSRPPIPSSRPVLFHSLKCLLLECDESRGSVSVTEFLSHVQLPQLISLAIVGEQQIQLSSFLSRSSCYLHRFILVDTPIFGGHIQYLLRHKSMRKLQSLKLERCRGAGIDLLIQELTGLQKAPLIPTLKMIYLGPVVAKGGYTAAFFATLSENEVYSHSFLPGAPSMGETFTFDLLDSEYA